MEPVESTVKEFILREFLPGARESELTQETPLISGGLLDSLATVRLMAFLEERYQIAIEPHEASIDYMDTLPQIARLVREKQVGR